MLAVSLNDLDQFVELHLPLEEITCFGGERNCTCGIRTQTDTFGIKEHGSGGVIWFAVESLLGALRWFVMHIKRFRTRGLIGRTVESGGTYERLTKIMPLDLFSVGTQG